MNAGETQEGGRHLILYDGVCGLCNWLNAVVLPRDPQGLFHFAALQSPISRTLLAAHGRNPDVLENMYVVADQHSASPLLLDRARAALFVLARLDSPLRHLKILGVLPTFILDFGYSLIARYRYRVFGKFDQCVMPSPEYAKRFRQ
jgi:predicted DCC family thiol-disulfide oxidoreductase YuxK